MVLGAAFMGMFFPSHVIERQPWQLSDMISVCADSKRASRGLGGSS